MASPCLCLSIAIFEYIMPRFSSLKTGSQVASYLFILVFVVITLKFHLLPAVLAGLLVFAITRRMERSILMNRSFSARAKMLSLMATSSIVCLLIFLIAFAIMAFLHRQNSWDGIMATVFSMLEQMRAIMPVWLQEHIPTTLTGLKNTGEVLFKAHSDKISGMGYRSLRTLALLFIGIVIGVMAAWSVSQRRFRRLPLSDAMYRRFMHLLAAFENVVFAQFKISAINTTLTAIYLLAVLPIFGVHLPYTKTLIALTFLVGLMPVIGNLVSNTAIMAVSATVSFHLMLSSLGFLVVIHKLEYFINAKIIGSRINAQAWELLIAIVIMETLFGAAGVVAAPILYAYMKNELTALGLIGINKEGAMIETDKTAIAPKTKAITKTESS